LAKYRFNEVKSVEDILMAIGRQDIPSIRVVIRRPCVDEETGEYISDFEVEIPDEYPLSASDEEKLYSLMMRMGLRLLEKV